LVYKYTPYFLVFLLDKYAIIAYYNGGYSKVKI